MRESKFRERNIIYYEEKIIPPSSWCLNIPCNTKKELSTISF